MFKHLHKSSRQLGIAAVMLFVGATAQAENPVSVKFDGDGLQPVAKTAHGGATLTISGPNGYYEERRGISARSLRMGSGMEDGIYKYEVTLEPVAKRVRKGAVEESVGRTRRNVTSGSFRVVNGAVVNPNLREGAGGQKK